MRRRGEFLVCRPRRECLLQDRALHAAPRSKCACAGGRVACMWQQPPGQALCWALLFTSPCNDRSTECSAARGVKGIAGLNAYSKRRAIHQNRWAAAEKPVQNKNAIPPPGTDPRCSSWESCLLAPGPSWAAAGPGRRAWSISQFWLKFGCSRRTPRPAPRTTAAPHFHS